MTAAELRDLATWLEEQTKEQGCDKLSAATRVVLAMSNLEEMMTSLRGNPVIIYRSIDGNRVRLTTMNTYAAKDSVIEAIEAAS